MEEDCREPWEIDDIRDEIIENFQYDEDDYDAIMRAKNRFYDWFMANEGWMTGAEKEYLQKNIFRIYPE